MTWLDLIAWPILIAYLVGILWETVRHARKALRKPWIPPPGPPHYYRTEAGWERSPEP